MTMPPPPPLNPTNPIPGDYNAMPPGRTGMAVTSMVLGVVGIVTGCLGIGLILGIVGLVLGIVALGNINREPHRYAGKGFAIAGIVTGICSMIFPIPLLIAILLPALGKARELSNRSACGANLRGIMQSFNVYAADDNDQYPTVLPPSTLGNYNG